jgi:uncharacterized membrane protein
MLQAFGYYGAVVGFLVIVEFFHLGFLIKKIHKEQQETNRILRQLVYGGLGQTK